MKHSAFKKYYLFAMLFVIGFTSGCASVSTAQRPTNYYQPSQRNQTETGFATDGNLLDKDIERLISHRLQLAPINRIAVLKLSSDSYWRYYSNDFTALNERIVEDFIGTLRSADRVYDASFLPTMLIPEQRTINFLREAAARYQADMLLAYRSDCRT